ncbi:MAG: hypothetical protein ACSW8F_03825 [bacterium]
MPQVVTPSTPEPALRETVCVHTDKIYDACKNRECFEDLRVWLTAGGQQALEAAPSVRARSAELLWVGTQVEPVQFNRGHFTIGLTYYYKVVAETGSGARIRGLAAAQKRVLLYGSEGNARIFRSDEPLESALAGCGKKPTCIVEALPPIVLDSRLVESEAPPEAELVPIPAPIAAEFEGPLLLQNAPRNLYVTLGQFALVRLERDAELLIPAYDYCVPEKECADASGDDPCALFSRIDFPVDEFFPPDPVETFTDTYREAVRQQ